MATYGFDPALSTLKDKVRSRIGDVSPTPQWFLADETIYAYLGDYSYDEACAQCAEAIGAQCIQLATSVSQKDLSLSYQGRSKAAYDLADRIRNSAQPGPGEPVNTGAAYTQMSGPPLDNYLISLPYGDLNDPRRNSEINGPTTVPNFTPAKPITLPQVP